MVDSNSDYSDFFNIYSALEPPKIQREESGSIKQGEEDLDFLDNISFLNNYQDFSFEFPGLSPVSSITNNFSFSNFNISDFINIPQSFKTQENITPKFGTQQDYVNTMYHYLYQALENNGIDGKKWAPILVAHTSIESAWGNEFSRRNNNFAGIKGKGSGKVKTKEWSPSRGYYTIEDSFKSYPSIQAFADDYVKMLKNRFHAFDGTPSEYASNIRKHKYFTAPLEKYQNQLDSRLKRINNLLQSMSTSNNQNKSINKDLISIDISDLLKQEGITKINGKDILFGNPNLRKRGVTYGSKNSHHYERDPLTGNANARDISIVGGTHKDYEDFKNILMSNPRVRQWLQQRNWGIINEIIPQVTSQTKATGPHFHFGPDRWARQIWNYWLNNPNTPVNQYIAKNK